MNIPSTYQVRITSLLRLDIILTNKNANYLRSYSHLVSAEQAAQFADTLESASARGVYFDIDKCPISGETFMKQNRLCLLMDGRIVHKKCFWKSKAAACTMRIAKPIGTTAFPRTRPFLIPPIWMARIVLRNSGIRSKS